MDQKALFEGLAAFLCTIVIITFHEFGHAFAAWRCGDDTARLQGRVTLNPAAHIDPVGTIILPLITVVLWASGSTLGGLIIGWGKPVPVNLANLSRPRTDDIIISLAGPAMNVVVALIAIVIARLTTFTHTEVLIDACKQMAGISMFLCFFNLLPIPPLDGSHVVKNIIGMTHETYWRLSQFGFFLVILAVQIPPVQAFLVHSTKSSLDYMAKLAGFRHFLG
jgi:Zn-dependent protease